MREPNLTLALVLVLSVAAIGIGSPRDAAADPTLQAQQAGAAIDINEFQYEPAELAAKVGQTITVTNNDDVPHTVTADDGTFDVDVPAKGSATLTIPEPGSYPYICTYHPNQHNPASINVS